MLEIIRQQIKQTKLFLMMADRLVPSAVLQGRCLRPLSEGRREAGGKGWFRECLTRVGLVARGAAPEAGAGGETILAGLGADSLLWPPHPT